MKLELCHTLSTETIQIDVPDTFKDLEHVVVINEGEAYQLKSTIPDEIKKKNELRKQFEDNEFETIRTTYYRDLDEDTDPDKFEQEFVDRIRDLIYVGYPELSDIITDDSIYHTICVHFVVYAVYKNREERLNQKNEKQKSDRCYAKDYAKRLIVIFKELSFSDPGSMLKFSEELNDIEKFMQGDERRHAGYDKLFSGISSTVTSLANAFISNDGEQQINIVKAFENVAKGEDNPDRKALISKIRKIIDTTITYYENYILSIDKIADDIKILDKDISAAYMIVARGLVAQFINNTDAFLNQTDPNVESKKDYKKQLDMFCFYFDDLVASFDDVTNNTTPDSVFATNLNYIWFNIRKAKSSESETWPTDLAKLLFDHYNEIFKDVPMVPTNNKSN